MANAAFKKDQSKSAPTSKPKAGSQELRAAIIFVKRSVVKSVVTRELQKFGIGDMHTMDSAKAAIRQLQEMPQAMLIIDWEHGEKSVVQVLKAAQGTYKVDTRPIYFLASELSPKLISIASDYNIIQLHVGAITPNDIRGELRAITSFSYLSEKCQKVFHETAMARSQGEWKNAEEPLKQLLAAEPTNIRAGLELAENYFETANYDAATDVSDRMIALDPDSMRARHLKARILLKRGDSEQALALLEDICERGALNLDRLVDLGQCLINIDQVDEATKQFEEALKLDGKSKKAAIGKSQCDLLLGNINEAVLIMRQIADDKEVAAIFNNTAILCIRRGQFEKALSLYRAAVSQVGKNKAIQARIIFNMGIGYMRWCKKREAYLAFTRAAELDGAFTKALHNVKVLSKHDLSPVAIAEVLTKPGLSGKKPGLVAIKEESTSDVDAEATKLFRPSTESVDSESDASTTVKVVPEKKTTSMTIGVIKTEQSKNPNPEVKEKPKAHLKPPTEVDPELDSTISDDVQDVVPDESFDAIFDGLDEDYFQGLIET